VLHIVETEKPTASSSSSAVRPPQPGVRLLDAGVPILGTQPESIDRAEDRELFQAMLKKLDLVQPANGTAMNVAEALSGGGTIGYPVIVRPSYVLGGRAMKIVYDREALENFTRLAIEASPEHPVLIDKFLEDAVEVDVDAISDGQTDHHRRHHGAYRGSRRPFRAIRPVSCRPSIHPGGHADRDCRCHAGHGAGAERGGPDECPVRHQGRRLFVIEVNPRASRTIPFVSKATGVPLAKLATKVMLGMTLEELGLTRGRAPHVSVKEAVLPFDRFPGCGHPAGAGDEIHRRGHGNRFRLRCGLCQGAAGGRPAVAQTRDGFYQRQDRDKAAVVDIARRFIDLGFTIMATRGTADFLEEQGLAARFVNKVSTGRPHVVDAIKNREIQLVINTGSGDETKRDGYEIRRAALKFRLPYATTIAGARAICRCRRPEGATPGGEIPAGISPDPQSGGGVTHPPK
jgi:carbamoyl-phosphate synthase large subunit